MNYLPIVAFREYQPYDGDNLIQRQLKQLMMQP